MNEGTCDTGLTVFLDERVYRGNTVELLSRDGIEFVDVGSLVSEAVGALVRTPSIDFARVTVMTNSDEERARFTLPPAVLAALALDGLALRVEVFLSSPAQSRPPGQSRVQVEGLNQLVYDSGVADKRAMAALLEGLLARLQGLTADGANVRQLSLSYHAPRGQAGFDLSESVVAWLASHEVPIEVTVDCETVSPAAPPT